MQVTRNILDETWLRLNPRILKYFLKRDFKMEDAEDLKTQTYIQAVSSLHTIRSLDNIDGWIFSIANTQVINHIRALNTQKRKTDLIPIEASLEHADPNQRAIDVDLVAREESASFKTKLRICIKKLPAQMRQVITLQYLEERPIARVAERLGIKVNTVKSTANAARSKLGACIKSLSKGGHHG